LPALTLPWSLWLATSPRRNRGQGGDDRHDWRRLMWAWLATVVVFFSLPQSKPVGYILPALFPLAFLVAEPALSAWRGAQPARRRAAGAALAVSIALCLAAVTWAATRYDRDHTPLARALAAARAPGDPVVFFDEYFFDVPLLAHLASPVPVIADWHDAKIERRDNWRRELAEAARFDRGQAARLLVDPAHGFALRCGNKPLWVLVKTQDETLVAAQPDAVRVAASRHAALWRLAPQACDATDARSPASKGP